MEGNKDGKKRRPGIRLLAAADAVLFAIPFTTALRFAKLTADETVQITISARS